MAEDIDIKIKTTGDTAGAEAVEKSLKKTGDAAEDINKKTTSVNDSEANLRGRAIAWAQMGERVREFGAGASQAAKNMQGLDAETQKLIERLGGATESVGGYVSTAAAAFASGGPLAALLAVSVKGAGDFVKAWGEAGSEIDKANKKSEEAVGMWKRLQDLKQKLPLIEALEAANKLLDEQLEKLTRNARVAESQRSLDQVRTEASGADAVRAGTQTAEGAEAKNLASSVNNDIAGIQETLEIAALAQAKLQGLATTAQNDANNLVEGTKEQAEKAAEAKKLQDESNAAFDTLNADRAIGANKIQELLSKGTESVTEVAEAGRAALSESVTTARDALKAEVHRLGANASAGAKASLAILDEVLEDGKIRAVEMAKYATSQGLLNGMTEKSNFAVAEAFQIANKNAAALINTIGPIKDQLREQASQILILQQR